jgi:hypothetical protein
MPRYEVRSDTGRQLDIAILVKFYGSTWLAILGRLNHRHDGYLFTLYEKNQLFKVYRVVEHGDWKPNPGGR